MSSGRGWSRRQGNGALDSNVDYASLAPLDGDEGELIDEACFVSRQPSLDIQEQERKRGIGMSFIPVYFLIPLYVTVVADTT